MGDCEFCVQDGSGHYCKIIPIPENMKKDYPHKFHRVMCFGVQERIVAGMPILCEARKKVFI